MIFVVGLVVPDAAETGPDHDLFDRRQRLQIEHGDSHVAEYFAGGAFDGNFVRASVTLNISGLRSFFGYTLPERMAHRLKIFWQRVTEGIEMQQLWAQFHADARASYKLYAEDVDWTLTRGESRARRFRRVVRALFWAMMMKLSPGRRVLFLISLVLLAFPASTSAAPSSNSTRRTWPLQVESGLPYCSLSNCPIA